jgi:hypothetical protein
MIDGAEKTLIDLACRAKPEISRPDAEELCEYIVAGFEDGEDQQANAPPNQQNAAPGGEPVGGSFEQLANHDITHSAVQASEAPPLFTRLPSQAGTQAHEQQAEAAVVDARPKAQVGAELTGIQSGAAHDQARFVSRRGWIKLPKSDLSLLNENCGGSAPTTFVVWVALLSIANYKQAATFQIALAVIQSVAGVSLRTTKTAIDRLQSLGFLRVQHHYDPRTKKYDANTFTLLRSCNHYPTPSGNDCPTPSGNKCTRGRATEVAEDLHRSEKESAKALKKEERVGARLSSAGAERAGAANASKSGPRTF